MGKKSRRGGSTSKTNNTGEFHLVNVDEPRVRAKDAVIDRWNTADDIPDEPEDHFDKQRDQVLFNPSAGLARPSKDNDGIGYNGQEVMALDDHYSDDSNDSDDQAEPIEYEQDDDEPMGRRQQAKAKLAAKKAGKLPAESKPATARLGTPDSSEAESEAEDDDGSDDDEDEDGRAKASYFGKNKYAYHGGDDLEGLSSDSEIDEETKRELEVREARKVQALARQDMTDADFGLAFAIPPKTGTEQVQVEVAPALAGIRVFKDRSAGGAVDSAEEREARRVAFEEPAATTSTLTANDQGDLPPDVDLSDIVANPRKVRTVLLDILRKSSPERIALAGEFGDELSMYQEVIQALPERANQHRSRRSEQAEAMGQEAPSDAEDPGMGLLQLHAQVYNAYATCLAFYMYLATLPSFLQDPSKLRTHPVMGRLLKFKRTLMALDELGLGLHPKPDPTGRSLDDDKYMDLSDTIDANADDDSEDGSYDATLDDEELADLIAEQDKENVVALQARRSEDQPLEPETQPKKKSKKSKKAAQTAPSAPLAEVGAYDAERDAEAAVANAQPAPGGKKRKRSAESGPSDATAAQGLGEPEALSEFERAERADRKKNLQFYTTQIDAREARRGKAREEKMSGDADLPWRDPAAARAAVERKRQAQVLAERAAGPPPGAELDNAEFDDRDEADRRAVLGGGDEEDDGAGYYNLIASSRKKAKHDKAASYQAARLAERDEAMTVGEGELEDGEHRGIGRTIEKNKGLTPKRKKEDRNPRVKKRMRFEQAQKKLRSMRPTYKGGENAMEGGYGGEASGISSHVIKSRKFA